MEGTGQNFFRSFEAFVFERRQNFVLILLGLLFVGIALFLFRAGFLGETEVEIVDSTESGQTQSQAVVEISGSVLKPGVYKVSSTSRIDDILVMAGGLSADADREWVERNLNRAAKVSDGGKIYIPSEGEVKGATGSKGIMSTAGFININTASSSELESLWGIGPARAESIMDNRPYGSVEELLTKKVVPKNVFEKIKDKVAI